MVAVEAVNVTKSYGNAHVLRGIDLHVPEGSVCALLGPNGAGKSSLVEILEGHRARTAGSVRVLNLDPGARRDFSRLRRVIGVVLQQTMLEPGLSSLDLLNRQASYYPSPLGVADLLDRVGLSADSHKLVRSLSGGMRRRLDLALALIGRPTLLFLDEPTTGLDPLSRRNVRELIRDVNEQGTTVVLTSHDLDEVEDLANTVHLLDHGHFVASGSPLDIVEQSSATSRIEFLRPASATASLPPGGSPRGEFVRYDSPAPEALLLTLRHWEGATQQVLVGLTITPPTLDDAYINLVTSAERERT